MIHGYSQREREALRDALRDPQRPRYGVITHLYPGRADVRLAGSNALVRGMVPDETMQEGDLVELEWTGRRPRIVDLVDITNVVQGTELAEVISALTVEEADGTPSVPGVSKIIFDQATGLSVVDNTDGSVTIQSSGGGGGALGYYHWGVNSNDLIAGGTLAIRHAVMTAGSLSGVRWTAFGALDIQFQMYVNNTLVSTHTADASVANVGSGAAVASVALGDYLQVYVSTFNASGDFSVTWY